MAVYALSGARPQKPDLDEFLDGDDPAWYSPPLLARIRSGTMAAPERAAAVGTPVADEPTAELDTAAADRVLRPATQHLIDALAALED